MRRPPAAQAAFRELLDELETERPLPTLAAGAPLAAALQLGQRHTQDELAAAGLREEVAAAEERRDALLAEAAVLMAPLGVGREELRRLVDRALSRRLALAVPVDAASPAARRRQRPAPPAPPVAEEPGLTAAVVASLLERAKEAGRRAGREESERLRRAGSRDAEPEPAAGAVLLLDVAPASALGEVLREVGAEPPSGMRLSLGDGAGCVVDLGELSPHQERRIQAAAAGAALAVLRQALEVEGCARVYDP